MSSDLIELCKSECKGEPTVDKGLQLLFLVWRFCKMLIIGKTWSYSLYDLGGTRLLCVYQSISFHGNQLCRCSWYILPHWDWPPGYRSLTQEQAYTIYTPLLTPERHHIYMNSVDLHSLEYTFITLEIYYFIGHTNYSSFRNTINHNYNVIQDITYIEIQITRPFFIWIATLVMLMNIHVQITDIN